MFFYLKTITNHENHTGLKIFQPVQLMWTSQQMYHQVNLKACVQTREGKERKWRAENY